MPALIENLATSSLASAIDNVQTTLDIQSADASRFPSPTGGDWFPLVLGNGIGQEIVKVTGRSGATLTVTRAQEGTSAAAWGAGTVADLRLSKAALFDMAAQLLAQLLTTRGDIITRDATRAVRLGKGTTGHVLQAGASDPLYAQLVAGAFATGPGIVTPAMLDNGAAVSLLGRSANSSGARADIAAGGNDTLLRRVSNALDFGQITAGMVPNAVLTYAMLASSAYIASGGFRAATASKLLNADGVWSDADFATLTDAATISVDMSAMLTLAQVQLGGNRTLGAPTNTKNGQFYCFKITATGSTRTLTLHANFKTAVGLESFPISVTTSETVYVCGFVESSTVLRVTGVARF